MSERIPKSELKFARTVARRAASVAVLLSYARERSKGATDEMLAKRLGTTPQKLRQQLLSMDHSLDRLSTLCFATGHQPKVFAVGGLTFFSLRDLASLFNPIDPMESAFDDSFFVSPNPSPSTVTGGAL